MNIVIIGAGAAGLMVAASILENTKNQEYHVHIFEKNISPGKKVIISGGGRCNVTTGVTDKKILATKYTRGWSFIERAMGKFSPKKCREWFESHGVPLKIQEDMRIFPISDDGHDIVGVFEKIFAKYRNKVSLHYSEGADTVTESEGKYIITTKKGSYSADILIITTGGNAYSHTGSNGDGYTFARALGHTVTPLGPSLSSFLTSETWLHELSGMAFEDASIIIASLPENPYQEKTREHGFPHTQEGQKSKILSGALLLTHFGISGPLTFMASSHLAFDNIGKGVTRTIHFSPIGGMDMKSWDEYLKISFLKNPKKLLINILIDELPRRFAEVFIEQYFSHLKEIFVGSIGRIDREKIADLLGNGIPLTLLERRPGDEFVTAGGVDTDELDPETMQSKIHKNLYFAGEILNVDGYTGGFSLQVCWASGHCVGMDIGKYL